MYFHTQHNHNIKHNYFIAVVGYFYTPLHKNINFINKYDRLCERLSTVLEHCSEVETAPLAILAPQLEVMEPPDERAKREEAVDQDAATIEDF